MPHTRITAIWSGLSGLPGYSRFRFSGALSSSEALAAANRVRTFFEAIRLQLPAGCVVAYAEAAQVYDDVQSLQGEVSYVPPQATTGGGTVGYAAPIGAVVNWLTGGVIAGRKVRGRTFLVPLISTAFTTAGGLASGQVTTFTTAAQTLLGGTPSLLVVGGKALDTYQAVVTGASVPNRAAVLRSRRD